MSVVKEKVVKANNKQSNDSKIPKRLEKLITSYWQNFFIGKIGKLKDAKIKLHINDKIPPFAQTEHRILFASRKNIQKEIEDLEQQDIIEDITSEATS